MSNEGRHELTLTPQLSEKLRPFISAVLGWTPEINQKLLILLERMTSKEKYALRQAFSKVSQIEELFLNMMYPRNEQGQLMDRYQIGRLSEIQIDVIPVPIVDQLKTHAGSISDIISQFFIGRTDKGDITSKGDPTQLSITLYGSSAETIHATLSLVLESLVKKDSQSTIANRDTVVVWGMPDFDTPEFKKLFKTDLQHSTDYGPNIVLILPTPGQKSSSRGNDNAYWDSVDKIKRYKGRIQEIFARFYVGSDPPKIAVIYYDSNSVSQSAVDVLHVRNHQDTGITIQALLSISPISPQVWAEFPEFKTLPEKLVQDINILSEGDTMLMKCLLHACHEYIQKNISVKLTGLTTEIVVIALQNYLQVFGISRGEAKDETLLQRLLLLARVVPYPTGIIPLLWGFEALKEDHNRRNDAEDLTRTISQRPQNILLEPLLMADLKTMNGSVYDGDFVSDEAGPAFVSITNGRKSAAFRCERLNQNFLRILKWLVNKGHVFEADIISANHAKSESGDPIFSVVCAYCDSNISGARVEKGQIIADNCTCENCGSNSFRLRAEYKRYDPKAN
ncbi:MAG: hypothetical protein AAB893_03085 [Patescibacteria group bacterium]